MLICFVEVQAAHSSAKLRTAAHSRGGDPCHATRSPTHLHTGFQSHNGFIGAGAAHSGQMTRCRGGHPCHAAPSQTLGKQGFIHTMVRAEARGGRPCAVYFLPPFSLGAAGALGGCSRGFSWPMPLLPSSSKGATIRRRQMQLPIIGTEVAPWGPRSSWNLRL